MKIGARPTDEQILGAMVKYGRSYNSTAIIRNILATAEFGRFDDLNTSHVLYRLKKLERAGKVRRVNAPYNVHHFWEVV